MKKHTLQLILILFIGFQAQSLFAHKVHGTIKLGKNKTSYVYLFRYIGTNFFKSDSSKIKSNESSSSFSFNIDNKASEIFRIGLGQNNSIEFFYDQKSIEINLNYSESKPTANTSSQVNTEFQAFRVSEANYDKTMQLLSQQMTQLSRQQTTQQHRDSAQKSIIAQFHKLNAARTQEMKTLHKKTSNPLLQDICSLFIIDTLNQSNFFNKSQFKKSAIIAWKFYLPKN